MFAPVQIAHATPVAQPRPVTVSSGAPARPAAMPQVPGAEIPVPLSLPAPAQFDALVTLIKSVFKVPAVGIALHGAPSANGRGVYRSFLEAPLIRFGEHGEEDEVIGALRVLDTAERVFDERDCTLLDGFARLIVEQVDLWSEASRDLLTDAMTRRAFTDALKKTYAASERHASPVTLLMFDLDHFKAVNDTYGHSAGDEVLKTAARVLRRELRVEDSFGRLGGEEFAVILSNTGLSAAHDVAERIRRAIEDAVVEDLPHIRFTASFGLVTREPGVNDDIRSATEWLDRADAALYRAKNEGRNRIAQG